MFTGAVFEKPSELPTFIILVLWKSTSFYPIDNLGNDILESAICITLPPDKLASIKTLEVLLK